MPSDESTVGEQRCENFGEEGKTVGRVAHIRNYHTAESHAIEYELCETCSRAFDMGAGNA